MLKKLWNDDCGAILSMEFILLTGLLVFGIGPGMIALRDSVNGNMAQIGKNLEDVVPKNMSHLTAGQVKVQVDNKNNNTQNQVLNNYNYIILTPRQP